MGAQLLRKPQPSHGLGSGVWVPTGVVVPAMMPFPSHSVKAPLCVSYTRSLHNDKRLTQERRSTIRANSSHVAVTSVDEVGHS